jgi:chromosome segregation protein
MRLAKLHINGFKSFPDRAELGFDTGVTAIVGPNGCGKSNVVDAITWVLGEQSAKSLRGERMEDVIFNGSDARKPTGAAEVRLKLSNVAQEAMTPASEPAAEADPLLDEQPIVTRDVEIGRRLYRSGESEYLIDGAVCRLRDVHDLLMDSGLGVKAYAVIEQGKIGQILSSRPAERRALIEEAAGVTKYKSRKRAAELKLEAARQNLTRVDDIVFEVEKQRGALKRQAARARRYRRFREELRRWEQVQFARRHEALVRDSEQAGARLADALAREAADAAHVAELEAALEGLRLTLAEVEDRSTRNREAAHARELEIGRREQQITFEKQQIEDLAGQAAAFAAERDDLVARRGPLGGSRSAQHEAAIRARAALEAAGERVATSEADYAAALSVVQAIEHESDETRAAVLAATSTLGALEQARDHAAASRDRVAADLERLSQERRDVSTELDRAASDGRAADAALAQAQASLEGAREARAAAEADVARLRVERERLADEAVRIERDLAAERARLDSLEALEASRASFGDAARRLLSHAPVGALGAVADHVAVDRGYERALEAVLGERLQHVLVETRAAMEAGLALVADSEAGRCGFVVLRDAPDEAATALPVVVPPGTQALSSVARAVGPHRDVVARLIPRALVADSLDDALRIAATVSVPVVTRKGDVCHGGWLIEAGPQKAARGILETRADILALRDRLTALARAAGQAREALTATDSALPLAEAAAAEAREAQHEREMAIVAIEARCTRAREDCARLARRLDLVTTERTRADAEAAAAETRRGDAVTAIALHALRQREAEGRLGGVADRLQAARDEAEARLRAVTAAQTEQAGLSERVAALDADVARLDDALADLEARISGRSADIGRTELRRAELAESIRATGRQLDDDIRALDALRDGLRAIDGELASTREEFLGRDQAIRVARHALDQTRTVVRQAEVARATALADLSHLEAACAEAVGLSIDDVVAAVARMEDAGELDAAAARLAASAAARDDEEGDAPADEGGPADEPLASRPGELTPEAVIADLKKKIERVGPVNMMAIEQFDELEARHAFLTTQRKDLLDSIAQTGEAIRKIDRTTRERFEEAFASINTHFAGTFTTLFGGGRAGLVLIDLENDDESGIDIIAQPPGKRLQNVQLLSGGEKALTAMALMFAIFKHRPSPFCLLDEIDAPLDDANIGRFVEMLQGMQEHTQFILITHNRKTMEIADRLYGVTMEEPGVSKLISLQVN